MTKRKKEQPKQPTEMTSKELAERLFSPELKQKLDEIAHEKDDKPDENHSHK